MSVDKSPERNGLYAAEAYAAEAYVMSVICTKDPAIANAPSWLGLALHAAFLAGFSHAQKSKWQPMETAPRDSTKILGIARNLVTTMRWYRGCQDDYWDIYIDDGYDEYGGYEDYREWEPTHWMPLPESPNEGKQ